jgi:hypothetical protein
MTGLKRGEEMKHLKMLCLAAVAAAALIPSIASATELTSPAGTRLPVGTTIHAVNEGTVVLTTSFKNIECKESTILATTTNETGSRIAANIFVDQEGALTHPEFTLKSCNCEVKVLKGGSIEIDGFFGGGNGTFISSGWEVTASCSTIFGTVHCLYSTNITGNTLGTLTGSTTTGATATLDIEGRDIPRLATSALCAEKAAFDAKYQVDNPDTLIIDK